MMETANRYWRKLRYICTSCEGFWWMDVPPGQWQFRCPSCNGHLVTVWLDNKQPRNPYRR